MFHTLDFNSKGIRALAASCALGLFACSSDADDGSSDSNDELNEQTSGSDSLPDSMGTDTPDPGTSSSSELPVASSTTTDDPAADVVDSEGACLEGFDEQEAGDRICASTVNGMCFTDDETACACAGCALANCAIAESFPTQVSCLDPDGS